MIHIVNKILMLQVRLHIIFSLDLSDDWYKGCPGELMLLQCSVIPHRKSVSHRHGLSSQVSLYLLLPSTNVPSDSNSVLLLYLPAVVHPNYSKLCVKFKGRNLAVCDIWHKYLSPWLVKLNPSWWMCTFSMSTSPTLYQYAHLG